MINKKCRSALSATCADGYLQKIAVLLAGDNIDNAASMVAAMRDVDSELQDLRLEQVFSLYSSVKPVRSHEAQALLDEALATVKGA